MNQVQEAVFGMAHASNATSTVALLTARYEYLGEGMEHAETMEQAEEIAQERRILKATLDAIKQEYAPGYFD